MESVGGGSFGVALLCVICELVFASQRRCSRIGGEEHSTCTNAICLFAAGFADIDRGCVAIERADGAGLALGKYDKGTCWVC